MPSADVEFGSGVNVFTGPLTGIFEQSLIGVAGVNTAGPVSVAFAGSTATLSLPADLQFTTTIDGNDVTLRFTGNIVATAFVPEPHASHLLMICGALMALWRRVKR